MAFFHIDLTAARDSAYPSRDSAPASFETLVPVSHNFRAARKPYGADHGRPIGDTSPRFSPSATGSFIRDIDRVSFQSRPFARRPHFSKHRICL